MEEPSSSSDTRQCLIASFFTHKGGTGGWCPCGWPSYHAQLQSSQGLPRALRTTADALLVAGKSTCLSHLAAMLAKRGDRVLMIDADAQANLTLQWFPGDVGGKEGEVNGDEEEEVEEETAAGSRL